MSNMNNGKLFIKTLRKIHYPEVDNLNASDFDWMFTKGELKPFLEVFCSLDEDNYLSAEELEEYSRLTSSELEKIQEFQNSKHFEDIEKGMDEKLEQEFSSERLLHTKNTIKMLESKMELFKKHKEKLLEENEFANKMLNEAKNTLNMYEMHYLPQVEDELITSLREIFSLIMKLHSIFQTDENCLASSDLFNGSTINYLDNEKKILECVKKYHENILKADNTIAFIEKQNLKNEEIQRELFFLQNALEKSHLNNILSENEMKKTGSTLDCLQNFESHLATMGENPSVIRQKLEDELLVQKKLKEREEKLIELLTDAISKNAYYHSSDVIQYSIGEQLMDFQSNIEKIRFPKDILLNLRARLDFLISSLKEYSKIHFSLKELIDQISKYVKEEEARVQEQKNFTEENMKSAKYGEPLSETSLFLSLYRILGGDCNKKDISMEDILEKTSLFHEHDERIKQQLNEKLEIVEGLKNQYNSLEKLLTCYDREIPNWQELEHAANTELNTLDIKLGRLKGLVAECAQDFDQKQKHIEKNRNVKLSRKLFAYALLNEDLFKKALEEVQSALKNSIDL